MRAINHPLFCTKPKVKKNQLNGSSTVADQKENLKLFNWLKSLKAT
jgi:hypothetical protein